MKRRYWSRGKPFPKKLCKQCGKRVTIRSVVHLIRKKFCCMRCKREHQAEIVARREREKQKRMERRVWKYWPRKTPRACDCCKKEYLPTAGFQKWCSICVPHQKARSLITRLGIPWSVWKNLFETQKGRCAICSVRFVEGSRRRACVDHDHKTKKVRSLLCQPCNLLVGQIESAPMAEKARQYLIAHGSTAVIQLDLRTT